MGTLYQYNLPSVFQTSSQSTLLESVDSFEYELLVVNLCRDPVEAQSDSNNPPTLTLIVSYSRQFLVASNMLSAIDSTVPVQALARVAAALCVLSIFSHARHTVLPYSLSYSGMFKTQPVVISMMLSTSQSNTLSASRRSILSRFSQHSGPLIAQYFCVLPIPLLTRS